MEFLTFLLIFCSSILFRLEIHALPVNKISSEELKVLVYEISNSSKFHELYSREIIRKEECNCGEKGTCAFDEKGDPHCFCENGYLEHLVDGKNTCKECNCGVKGTCKLDETGDPQCTCENGYLELIIDGKKTCEGCNCGENGKCKFEENAEKVCICDPRYLELAVSNEKTCLGGEVQILMLQTFQIFCTDIRKKNVIFILRKGTISVPIFFILSH
ncbi:hypothetical protein NPIL_665131 [Nephila pilipes]|uniref:EGF-like domain-containing protein n=1 Tax=Nephila pilipes TaxID=299642 RepID=A0A8X6NFP7_NEPPI|nr:hypothetical protein NPIL_665131 [Nephila pilipes]